jgi:hypothetical protein
MQRGIYAFTPDFLEKYYIPQIYLGTAFIPQAADKFNIFVFEASETVAREGQRLQMGNPFTGTVVERTMGRDPSWCRGSGMTPVTYGAPGKGICTFRNSLPSSSNVYQRLWSITVDLDGQKAGKTGKT